MIHNWYETTPYLTSWNAYFRAFKCSECGSMKFSSSPMDAKPGTCSSGPYRPWDGNHDCDGWLVVNSVMGS